MQRRSLPAAEWRNNAPLGRGEVNEGSREGGNMSPRAICLCHHPSPRLILPSTLFPSLHYVLFSPSISLYLSLALNLIMLHWGDVCWQRQLDADNVKLHIWRFWCVLLYHQWGVWRPEKEAEIEVCVCLDYGGLQHNLLTLMWHKCFKEHFSFTVLCKFTLHRSYLKIQFAQFKID